MKITKIVVTTVAVIAVSACISFSILKSDNSKIAFIELNKVYTGFQMKKDLELQMKSVQQKRNNILDSLKLDLQVLSRQIESRKSIDEKTLAVFNIKRDSYLEKDKQFSEDNIAMAKSFDEQIFTQLNQYVKDFGLKQGYSVILGAEGSGALMYGKESINITEEVSAYINQRFSGKAE